MTAVALDSPDLGQRARKHRLTSTIGAGLLNTNTSLSVVTGFLALPGSQYFGVAISQFLLWYTIFTLATAASLPLIGKMTTILGVRFVTILSGLVVTASIISLTFVENNIFIYYAICVPYGIGWGGCTVLPANTLATAWHQHKRRGTILGFVAMGSGLGAFVWGIVFPPIIAGGGFHGGLYAVAAFSFLLTVVNGLVLVRNPQGVAGRKAEAEAIAAGTGTRASIDRSSLLLGFGGVVAVLVVLAFTFALETSFSQMSGAVYAGSGVSLTVAGFLVSYYSIVAIMWKPVLGWLHDRFGMKALLIIFAVTYLMGLPLLALLRTQGTWVFFVILPIVAVALSAIGMLMPLVTVRAVGTQRFPVAYGMVLSGAFVGVSAGVPLWGLNYDLTGNYDFAMYLSGLFGVVGCVLAWIGFSKGQRILASKGELGDEAVGAETAEEFAADASDDKPLEISVDPARSP